MTLHLFQRKFYDTNLSLFLFFGNNIPYGGNINNFFKKNTFLSLGGIFFL